MKSIFILIVFILILVILYLSFYQKRKKKTPLRKTPKEIFKEKERRKKLILEKMKGMEEFSFSQVQYILGFSEFDLKRYLEELKDEGKIEEIRKGNYRII